MRIVQDNISRNVLVYLPPSKFRSQYSAQSTASEEIKDLNKKIRSLERECSRQHERKRQQQIQEMQQLDQQNENQEIQFQFGRINKVQNKQENNNENFDFLTGIGIQGKQDQEEEQEEEEEENQDKDSDQQQSLNQQEQIKEQEESDELNQGNKNFVDQMNQTDEEGENGKQETLEVLNKFVKVQQHYQNQISKAFLDREKQQKARKKKNPKLGILAQNMKIKEKGRPLDQKEHLMRVYNKEHFPCKPYVMVPSFNSKKDNVTQQITSYLKDYKPLLQGQKNMIPKSIQQLLEVELEMLKQIEILEKSSFQNDKQLQQKKMALDNLRSKINQEKQQKIENQDMLQLFPVAKYSQQDILIQQEQDQKQKDKKLETYNEKLRKEIILENQNNQENNKKMVQNENNKKNQLYEEIKQNNKFNGNKQEQQILDKDLIEKQYNQYKKNRFSQQNLDNSNKFSKNENKLQNSQNSQQKIDQNQNQNNDKNQIIPSLQNLQQDED